MERQVLTGGDYVKKPVMRYRTTRRDFAELVREYAGTDQTVADQMVDGVLGAIRTWALNAAAALEENTEARLGEWLRHFSCQRAETRAPEPAAALGRLGQSSSHHRSRLLPAL